MAKAYRIGKKIGLTTNEHHINNVRQPRGGLSREAAAVRLRLHWRQRPE